MDAGSLFVSLIVSAVGFALFQYGRKQLRMPQIVAGLVMMVYPYFIAGLLAMLGVGAAILGLMYAALQLDL
jgi:hypothetical protein